MIEAVSLTKSFAGREVVGDLSFSVPDGEVLAILGPSGCGKSTTLRMLAGLTSPDRGAVRVGGADVSHLPPHRRGVSLVFQQPAFLPGKTVAQNIAYPLVCASGRRLASVKLTPDERRRAEELAARFRISRHLDGDPAALSGGERQRVALARALAKPSRVLLLDEPLSGLDAWLRDELLDELGGLRDGSRSVILVTHDQQDAFRLADRVLVMKEGRAEQLGTPAEVRDAPATRFVAVFVRGRP